MKGRVFQRTKGRGRSWSFVVDLPPSGTGRRRQRLKGGFATRAAAEKALAEYLVDLDKGMAVDPSRQALGEYLDDWLAAVSPSLWPTTADLYRRAVDNWIRPRLGGVPLQALTPKHLQDLYATLGASGRVDGSGGLSPRSVRLAHQVLRLALGRAADWRLIARSPALARLDLPRMQHQPMQTSLPFAAISFVRRRNVCSSALPGRRPAWCSRPTSAPSSIPGTWLATSTLLSGAPALVRFAFITSDTPPPAWLSPPAPTRNRCRRCSGTPGW